MKVVGGHAHSSGRESQASLVPRVTKVNFLLTVYIHNQEKMLWELMKWSPDGKGFDLQTNSLNQFFEEMYGAQSGERVFAHAEWRSGQCVGLAIRCSWDWVPLWPLAGFVLSCLKFKSSAMLVNCQLVASSQLGFLILLPCICIFCF